MIYLASPYSHPEAKVRQERFDLVCAATARLLSDGHLVFSPVAHSHPLTRFGLPCGFEFWEAFDFEMLSFCDALWIFTLDGWTGSLGVRREMRIARELQKPVFDVQPTTLERTEMPT